MVVKCNNCYVYPTEAEPLQQSQIDWAYAKLDESMIAAIEKRNNADPYPKKDLLPKFPASGKPKMWVCDSCSTETSEIKLYCDGCGDENPNPP